MVGKFCVGFFVGCMTRLFMRPDKGTPRIHPFPVVSVLFHCGMERSLWCQDDAAGDCDSSLQCGVQKAD